MIAAEDPFRASVRDTLCKMANFEETSAVQSSVCESLLNVLRFVCSYTTSASMIAPMWTLSMAGCEERNLEMCTQTVR